MKDRLTFAVIAAAFGWVCGAVVWFALHFGNFSHVYGHGSVLDWANVSAALSAVMGFSFKEDEGSILGALLFFSRDHEGNDADRPRSARAGSKASFVLLLVAVGLYVWLRWAVAVAVAMSSFLDSQFNRQEEGEIRLRKCR